jgi:aarF domain-containing kinase
VYEDDFKCKLEDVFSEFDEKAIAAASLAQVHRARLKETGEEVAVKL